MHTGAVLIITGDSAKSTPNIYLIYRILLTTKLKRRYKVMLPNVRSMMIFMGCDPEFFFKAGTHTIGAEKFLPKNGFRPTHEGQEGSRTYLSGTKANIIIDGVQAELNPRPNTCRANLANEIAQLFKELKSQLDKEGHKVSVSVAQTVKIRKDDLEKLDKDNQKFGCAPSFNTYKDNGAKLKSVDPLEYRTRAAGGHIHIGTNGYPELKELIEKEPHKLVAMLDLICGNTCVLVDRDKGNKERRKLYGQAGEYRLPQHGLEYRTLSNFWLKSYPLMSLAFGLARIAVELVSDTGNGDLFYEKFMAVTNMKDVQKAINENDFDLALRNYKKIEPLLKEVLYDTQHFPFGPDLMGEFMFFVHETKRKGLNYWFPEDSFEHWVNLPEAHKDGFYYFLKTTVKEKYRGAGA